MLRIIYMSASKTRISVIPGRFKKYVAVRMARSSETVRWVAIHCSNLSAERLTTPTRSTDPLACGRHISKASAGSQLASRENKRVLSLSVGRALYTCCRQTIGVLGSVKEKSPDRPKTKLDSGSKPHSTGCVTMASPGASSSISSIDPAFGPGCSCVHLVSGRTNPRPASHRPSTWRPLRVNFTKWPPQGQWQWVKLECKPRTATCQ
mmetsp:Transcript_14248/g.26700  ORF Transcript_14248/g.26700 Transcript_14248/m.26700 type:complete len:207 (+) Transcript_14248:1065-1685(+)